MNNKSFICALFIALVVCSCKNLDLERITKVVTKDISWQNNALQVAAEIIDIADNGVSDYGVCYAIDKHPTIDNGTVISKGETGITTDYKITIPNIILNKTYYVRSYAISGNEVIYGEVRSLYTAPFNIYLSCDSAAIAGPGKVQLKSRITNIGSLKIKEHGHCYALTNNPLISNQKLVGNGTVLNGAITLTDSILNLLTDTNYYIRAYLILENNQVQYSNVLTARIKSNKVITQSVSIGSVNKDLQMVGKFTQIGPEGITEYGFCWSNTTPYPGFNDNKVSISQPPAENMDFNGFYKKQTSDTLTYYVRAYAIYSNNIIYGNILNIRY